MDHQPNQSVRRRETRTKEISNMISEGGLGAEKYYSIRKKTNPPMKEIRLYPKTARKRNKS